MRRYPTENGIAVPTCEIWLPDSNLDPEQLRNKNNHHTEYTARNFGRCILFKTVRDIETHQELLYRDVHNYIHSNYDIPTMPTPKQAINEIERAKHYGERLHIHENGHYVYKELTDLVLRACIKNYDELTH